MLYANQQPRGADGAGRPPFYSMQWTEPPYNRRLFSLIAALLVFLLLLGFGQLQIFSYQRRLAGQCDRLLFQYSSIREYIISALLEKRTPDLQAAIGELEGVNDNLARLLQNPVIPDRFKMSLLSRADLSGIMLRLRQAVVDDDPKRLRALQDDLRIFGDGLQLFHRMLSEHVKKKVVGYQSLIIGVLVLAVLLLGNVLFFLHRRVMAPVAALSRQMENGAGTPCLVIGSHGRWLAEILTRFTERCPDGFLSWSPLPALVMDGQGTARVANEHALKIFGQNGTDRQTLADSLRQKRQTVRLAGRQYGLVYGDERQSGIAVLLVPVESMQCLPLTITARTLLGSLTAGLCHEIGQACNIIMNACQLARDDAAALFLEQIEVENERIATLVRLLCALGTASAGGARNFQLGRILKETVRLMKMQCMADRGGVTFDCEIDPGRAAGDGRQLQLVLLLVFGEMFDSGCKSVRLSCRPQGQRAVMVLLQGTAVGHDGAADGLAASLRLCQAVVEANGGELQLPAAAGGQRQVMVRWPLCPGSSDGI